MLECKTAGGVVVHPGAVDASEYRGAYTRTVTVDERRTEAMRQPLEEAPVTAG
jgi:hypothetical protein